MLGFKRWVSNITLTSKQNYQFNVMFMKSEIEYEAISLHNVCVMDLADVTCHTFLTYPISNIVRTVFIYVNCANASDVKCVHYFVYTR